MPGEECDFNNLTVRIDQAVMVHKFIYLDDPLLPKEINARHTFQQFILKCTT